VRAAVLLVARMLLESAGLACHTVEALLQATHATRSRAYELSTALIDLLPTLARPRGRPTKAPSVTPAAGEVIATVSREVLRYVTRHPGCVDRGAERQWYSDGFRRFILELRGQHADLADDAFAHAADLPLGTLKDWLRAPASLTEKPREAAPEQTRDDEVEGLHLQTVLHGWKRWDGSFLDFCEHVRRDLLIPFGRDLVRQILSVHGARTISRRAGRCSSDERALRSSFRTFFPNAQWVGDGMQVPVVLDGKRFDFNLELDVDAHTGALVGLSVRDEEDSAAVVEAFERGSATTGAPPLALLLDNKPSNHTPDVDAVLGDTLRIRATLERPQNKAHVEGAFGLFSQVLPPLVLDTHGDPQELARGFLTVVAETWARTTNHRPRGARGGRSRVELYAQTPTEEQIEEARRALRETAERQERARRTLEARRRPDVLALLDDSFTNLALLDPERHVRVAIAGYPRYAIVNGLAIYAAKQRASTLPDGVDARYLLGIVKNVTAKTEGEFLAEELYDRRVAMRDRILAPLIVEREALRKSGDVARIMAGFVDHALEWPVSIERTFWLDALTTFLTEQPEAPRRALFLDAARRIEATYAVPPRERHDVLRYVADRLVPLT
jgi:hypothetical protein